MLKLQALESAKVAKLHCTVTVTQAGCTGAAKANGGQTVINSGLTASSEPQKGAPGEGREDNSIARNVACKSFRGCQGGVRQSME